ncbi:MAG: hypothetical protein ACXVEF_11610 [Polyangiales bacterium]
MRVVLWSAIALLAVGCSPSPGDVTLPSGANGKPVTRQYPYECSLPTPGETTANGTFESIYTEIISDQTGVARCQNGACHGSGASNGGLSLGSTKKDAYCGLANQFLVQPLDCTSCDFCAGEAKTGGPGSCGDDAGVTHPCCAPCSTSDAGSDAPSPDGASDGASDGSSEAAIDEVPVSVAAFHDIVAPNSKGEIRMPKVLCGNRQLNKHDRAGIRAWGLAGAPLD